jgi:branched-chain amino acid transport system substrate-binding protein
VYVLDDRGLYGKGIADVFSATAESLGLKVLGREGIDPKAQEYKSLMAKIKQLGPDFVYFGGATQTNAGQIAKDLVASGQRAKLMVPDACFEEAFIKAAGADNVNERVHVTFGGLPPAKLTGRGAEFVKRYREKYKSEPESYAVYGYVATQVALDALRKAGQKRPRSGAPGRRRDEADRRRARHVVLRRERRHEPQDHERQRGEERQVRVLQRARSSRSVT